ncbi:hypothetical protein PM082_015564 [Marasmius tenuissimus]|nr:hypothetical protein PM082_015564 [Marasmius tenuissimus]
MCPEKGKCVWMLSETAEVSVRRGLFRQKLIRGVFIHTVTPLIDFSSCDCRWNKSLLERIESVAAPNSHQRG